MGTLPDEDLVKIGLATMVILHQRASDYNPKTSPDIADPDLEC